MTLYHLMMLLHRGNNPFHARAKADIATSTEGLKVVGVRSINLNEFAIHPPFPPPPIPLAKQSLAAEAADNRPTPIISGQEEVTTNVGVILVIHVKVDVYYICLDIILAITTLKNH